MREADIQSAAELEKKYFSIPWSEENLRQSFGNPEYLFLVAEKEGVVVGYAGLFRVLDEGDITNIVIDEKCRGCGLGKKLTSALLTEGGKLGIRAFTLEVRVSNHAAIRIYEELGFIKEGIRKRFYEKPIEDALIMWKREPE